MGSPGAQAMNQISTSFIPPRNRSIPSRIKAVPEVFIRSLIILLWVSILFVLPLYIYWRWKQATFILPMHPAPQTQTCAHTHMEMQNKCFHKTHRCVALTLWLQQLVCIVAVHKFHTYSSNLRKTEATASNTKPLAQISCQMPHTYNQLLFVHLPHCMYGCFGKAEKSLLW